MGNLSTWSRLGIAAAAAVVTLPLLIGGCPQVQLQSQDSQNIMQVVQSTGTLSTLAGALEQSGVSDTLTTSTGPYTLFAPTNDAFAALSPPLTQDLLQGQNPTLLNAVMQGIVVRGAYSVQDLHNGQILTTINGQGLEVTVENGVGYVGGAPIIQANIGATNGVIHMVGSVILPPGT